MTDHLTYQIVRRLRAPGAPLSRNRHFSVFDTPEGRRALRIHKRVRGIETDLLNHGEDAGVSLTKIGEDTVRVDIHLPHLRARRTTFLTRAELDILLDSSAGQYLRSAEWTV